MTCENCGTELAVRTGKGRSPSRFCSVQCKAAVYARGDAEARAERRRTRPPCVICGKPIPSEMNLRAVTCSRECGITHQNRRKQERKNAIKIATRKPCEHCGDPIPEDRHGRAKFCSPECKKKMQDARWRERAPGYMRQYLYGLTPDQFAAMLADQDGRCAICGADSPGGKGGWHVDHCHDRGHVRGLLCNGCNLMLGHAQDDPARLRAAAEYLERLP